MTVVRLSVIAALLAGTAIAAHAAPSAPQLRHFELTTISPSGPSQSNTGTDNFNNGDPYTGLSYERGTPGFPIVAGGYQASSFTPGAELTGAASDYAGTQFGVGGLNFRRSDATDTTDNLTPAGANRYSTLLRTAVVPGTALGLANQGSGFSITSVWNYSPLQAGESISMVLTGTNGPNYTDRLNLIFRSDYATGALSFSFEQQSLVGSAVTRTSLGSIAPGNIFASLGQVDYFALHLERALPGAGNTNPGVFATIALFDAALDSDGGLLELAHYTFDTAGLSFGAGTSGFAGVFMAANWIEPSITPAVPEPGTWAMMAFGFAALGFTARRRRA